MKPIRHESVINKLACYGFEPTVDPDNPDVFLVNAGDSMGSWRRKPDGNVIRLKASPNGYCHRNASSFIDELKKSRNPNRTMN